MTSKLKCPFCQKGLSQGYNHDRDTVIYHCNNCYFQGDKPLWQALNESYQATLTNARTALEFQKDLEIARKALTDIFFICEQDASKDANTRISEIYAITKKVLEYKE